LAKDPEEKLEELRRNSLVELENLWNQALEHAIPERDHPDSLASKGPAALESHDGAAETSQLDTKDVSLATQVLPEAEQEHELGGAAASAVTDEEEAPTSPPSR
jgi:hypothetical protein